MLTTIPFSGFYNSLHDSEIDQTIERMFSDRDTGCITNDGIAHRLWQSCQFKQVHEKYAKAYCEAFADEFEIAIQFESMQSPREYNFTTDVIFANIEMPELRKILAKVDRNELADLVRQTFTSCDGFISFYSNDLDSWGDVSEWDHNQCGTLLQCLAGSDFDQWREYDLVSDFSSCGRLDNWVCDATPNINRLFKIHNYLESRAAR